MLDLPNVPPTFTVRYLECVCCKEQFNISEAFSPRNHPDHSSIQTFSNLNHPHTFWRTGGDDSSVVNGRFHPPRNEFAVRPANNATRIDLGVADTFEGNERTIICPRCGADNRNWLQLTTTNGPRGFLRFRNIPENLILLLLFMLLFPAIYALGLFVLGLSNRHAAILATMVYLVPVFTYFGIINGWRRQREFENGRSYLPNEAKPPWWQSPALQTVVGIALIALVALPAFMRFYQPLRDRVETMLDQQEPPSLLERLDTIEASLATRLLAFEQQAIQPIASSQLANNAAIQVNPINLSPSLAQSTAIPWIPAENSIRSLAMLNNANRTYICENLQIQAMINRLETFRQPTEARVRATLIENSIMQLRALQESDGVACRPELLQIAALSIVALQNEVVEQCRTTGEYACVPVENPITCQIESYRLEVPTAVKRDPGCDIGFLTTTSQTLNALAQPLDPNAPLTTQNVRATLIQTRLLAENSPTLNITERIDTQVAMLEDFMDDSQAAAPFFTKSFIRVWLFLVGLALFIGAGTGFSSLNRFVGLVRQQTPRPFYYSVAQMSRIVAWEANIALEIGQENFDHIEWRAVGRTTDGGVHLRGALRDAASLPDSRGLVRATIYEVESDRWGKIILAEARNGRLPPKPQPPSARGGLPYVDLPLKNVPEDDGSATAAYQPIYIPLN